MKSQCFSALLIAIACIFTSCSKEITEKVPEKKTVVLNLKFNHPGSSSYFCSLPTTSKLEKVKFNSQGLADPCLQSSGYSAIQVTVTYFDSKGIGHLYSNNDQLELSAKQIPVPATGDFF